MKCDTLIIGQGIAGSVLAWVLIRRGQKVMVIDDNHSQSSSFISAGLINPITGQRCTLTENFQDYFDAAARMYEAFEGLVGCPVMHRKPVIRLWRDAMEHKRARQMSVKFPQGTYIETFHEPFSFGNKVHDPLGSMTINHTAWCPSRILLEGLRAYIAKAGVMVRGKAVYADIVPQEHHVTYHGDTFNHVIFCEGFQGKDNPWFSWLPFNVVKGEILRLRMRQSGLPEAILSRQQWCVPIGHDEWIAGATYDRDQINTSPTSQGRQEILEGLKTFIAADMDVLTHHAGVRPAMVDQMPVLGLHPNIPSLGIFNGLGSKGFLMAPLCAQHMAALLIDKKECPASLSHRRFSSKLPTSSRS